MRALPTHPPQRTECWVPARHNEWAHSSSQVQATPATARQHQCHGQQSGIGDAGRNAAQSDSGGQRNRRLVPYMMGDKHGVDGNSPQRSTRTGLRARKDRDTSSAAASTLPRPSTNHALSPTHHHAGLHISHAKCAHAAGRHVNCSHAHASTHNKRAGTSCIHKLHPQAHNLCHPFGEPTFTRRTCGCSNLPAHVPRYTHPSATWTSGVHTQLQECLHQAQATRTVWHAAGQPLELLSWRTVRYYRACGSINEQPELLSSEHGRLAYSVRNALHSDCKSRVSDCHGSSKFAHDATSLFVVIGMAASSPRASDGRHGAPGAASRGEMVLANVILDITARCSPP